VVSIYREDVKTRRRKVAGAMSWLRYFLLWIPIEVASNAQFPGAQPSEPTLLQGIEYDKFEPAVAEQIRLAREETRHKPRDAEAFGKLGMIFQVYGKYELAETCYGRARALAPRSFRWTYYLGNVEGWLGKYSEAVSYVQEALTIDPGYAPARVRLAQLLFESGDMEQSARLYEELSEKNPGLASAHFGLGRVRSARGDWTGAIEAYRRACRIYENYAAAHYALGLAYRKVGDVVKAREHLGRYERVKLLPQPSEDALMDVVKSFYAGGLSHFARGSALVQQGKLQEAAAAFESALKVNPRMGIAHVNLIAIYGELNLPEKAEQHYRDSVQLDPGWVEAQYNWGMFLFRQGRKEEAAQAFRRAVQLNPNYADAQAQLGLALEEIGRPEEAERYYRLALESNPAHRQAQYLLGRSLTRTGRFGEAISYLLETVKVEDDKTPSCLQLLAIAYERAGDRGRAVYYTRQARERAVSLKMHQLAAQLQGDLDRLAAKAK